MPQLIVRNLEHEIVERLKLEAARNGRSAEAEHREILRRALKNPAAKSFKEMLLSMPDVGQDSDFERDQDFGRDIDW